MAFSTPRDPGASPGQLSERCRVPGIEVLAHARQQRLVAAGSSSSTFGVLPRGPKYSRMTTRGLVVGARPQSGRRRPAAGRTRARCTRRPPRRRKSSKHERCRRPLWCRRTRTGTTGAIIVIGREIVGVREGVLPQQATAHRPPRRVDRAGGPPTRARPAARGRRPPCRPGPGWRRRASPRCGRNRAGRGRPPGRRRAARRPRTATIPR